MVVRMHDHSYEETGHGWANHWQPTDSLRLQAYSLGGGGLGGGPGGLGGLPGSGVLGRVLGGVEGGVDGGVVGGVVGGVAGTGVGEDGAVQDAPADICHNCLRLVPVHISM